MSGLDNWLGSSSSVKTQKALGATLLVLLAIAFICAWLEPDVEQAEKQADEHTSVVLPYTQLCFKTPDGTEPIVNINAMSSRPGVSSHMLAIPLVVQEDGLSSCGEVYFAPQDDVVLLYIFRDNRNPAFDELWERRPPFGDPNYVVCEKDSCTILLYSKAKVRNAFGLQLTSKEDAPLYEHQFHWVLRNRKPSSGGFF